MRDDDDGLTRKRMNRFNAQTCLDIQTINVVHIALSDLTDINNIHGSTRICVAETSGKSGCS